MVQTFTVLGLGDLLEAADFSGLKLWDKSLVVKS